MTEEERWKIEGRTRESLRQARSRLGLLRADIAEHSRRLKEASEALEHFASDPTGSGPTGMSKPEYLADFWRTFIPPTIEEKLRELAKEAGRVQELEKQVASFE